MQSFNENMKSPLASIQQSDAINGITDRSPVIKHSPEEQ